MKCQKLVNQAKLPVSQDSVEQQKQQKIYMHSNDCIVFRLIALLTDLESMN